MKATLAALASLRALPRATGIPLSNELLVLCIRGGSDDGRDLCVHVRRNVMVQLKGISSAFSVGLDHDCRELQGSLAISSERLHFL